MSMSVGHHCPGASIHTLVGWPIRDPEDDLGCSVHPLRLRHNDFLKHVCISCHNAGR